MTFRELHELAMPIEKRKEEQKNIFAYYFLRPISYIVTKPLLKTNVTPNTISCISLIFSILGFCIMVCNNTMVGKLIGLFCFFAWNILDCVDGNIARVKKMFSPIGKLWDAAAGYAAMALMYFSMGISAFSAKNSATVIYVILGGLTAIFCLYPRLLMHFKYSENEKNDLNNKEGYSFIKNFIFNLTSPDCLLQIIMLVFVLENLEYVFTIVYFFLYGGIAFYSSYGLLTRN